MNRSLKVWLWLLPAVLLAYVWSINGAFHFDDTHSVESNLTIRSLLNIPRFWVDSTTSSFIPENRVYRPLVYTFYAFCWWLGGGATWPFHLMKLLMQSGVALALFSIWNRLFSQPGWFPKGDFRFRLPLSTRDFSLDPSGAALLLALLFAIHPAGSECAIYVSSTTSLQCALFYSWAFKFYLDWRDGVGSGRSRLWACLAFYFMSVASKEEGITLPAIIFISEFMLSDGFVQKTAQAARSALRRALPIALFGTVLAAWWYVMRPVEGTESHGFVSPWNYFMTQWRAYLFYMRIWFWPFDLNADNTEFGFSSSLLDPRVIQAAIGNLAVLFIAWSCRKRFPAVLFGVLWFYVTISPASSFVPLAEPVNEHRMYLSYIGFGGATLVVLLASARAFWQEQAFSRRLGWAIPLVFVGLTIGTLERNRVWLNAENLWFDTVEKNPTSGRALNNLALVYMSRAEYDKAIERLDACERFWSTYLYCPLNKGVSYIALKRYDEAEKSLLRAYQLGPRNVHVNFHLANFYDVARQDHAKAAEYFLVAVSLTNGRYPAADVRAASALVQLRRFDEARTSLRRALESDPENAEALFALGRLEFDTGKVADAIATYRRTVRSHPSHLQAWYNLGVALMNQGALEEARQSFERTVAIDPNSEQGLFNLAFVNEKLANGQGAIEAARRLAAVQPDNVAYRSRLDLLQKRFGSR